MLCLFNSKDEVTFEDIKDLTQIQEAELNPAMIFMCNPKVKLLLKQNPKSPKFEPTEKVSPNP